METVHDNFTKDQGVIKLYMEEIECESYLMNIQPGFLDIENSAVKMAERITNVYNWKGVHIELISNL